MNQTVIIANPVAGRARRTPLSHWLEKHDFAAPIWTTSRAGEAQNLAARALDEGFSTLIAAGGDGTLSEVVNGVLHHQRANETIVGVLPLGTGNDFARGLGVGTDISRAIEVIKNGQTRLIDVGKIEIGEESRFWINVAGAGFDALVAKRINDWRTHRVGKHLSGTTAYLAAVVAELGPFCAADLKLELDDELIETRAVLCAIANAQSYGGGMKIAPNAKLDDGFFDVCLIHETSRSEFLRTFPQVFSGRHISHPRVSMHRARRVKLQSYSPLPILVDGELVGCSPATFQIVPRVLQVLSAKFPG